MIITCKECSTSFNLDADLLQEGGSKVRCSVCKDIFMAYPPATAKMHDPSDNFPSSGTDKKHSENKSNESLQSSYREKRFAGTDPETAVSVADVATDILREDFQAPADSLIEDIAAASKDFEKEEPGVAAKPGTNSTDMPLDLDYDETDMDNNNNEQKDLDSDLGLSLDLDLEHNNKDADSETAEDIELELDMEMENPLTDEEEALDALEDDPQHETDIKPSLAEEIEPQDTEPGLDSFQTDLDAAEEDSEDIELALESLETAEEKDSENSIQEDTTICDEINLADIENMLELDDETQIDDKEVEGIEDIELELDTELSAEEKKVDSLETGMDEDEIDDRSLEELEQLLGLADGADAADGFEHDEVEINLGADPGVEEIENIDPVDDETLSLDLEEIEVLLDDGGLDTGEDAEKNFEETLELDTPEVETAPDEIPLDNENKIADSIQLDFDLDESDKADLYKKNSSDEKEKPVAAEPEDTSDQSESQRLEDEDETASCASDVAAKKRSGKPVLALLILILLGGGVYGAYTLLKGKDIKIPVINNFFKSGIDSARTKIADLPYINEIFESEKKDPAGALKITPLESTITGEYFTSSKAGNLFVVKGTVKNEYDHPRSFIKVKVNLFSKGGVLSKTKTVYCGNILSNLDIENLDFKTITKRLMNRNGDRKSNINVKPEAEISFMAIFSNLPDDINMFNVEIDGSAP